MQGSNGNTGMENRLADTVGEEGEGGMNGESSMEISTPPYGKQIASGNLLYDSENSNRGSVSTQKGGMGREMGWRLKRRGYMYTYG